MNILFSALLFFNISNVAHASLYAHFEVLEHSETIYKSLDVPVEKTMGGGHYFVGIKTGKDLICKMLLDSPEGPADYYCYAKLKLEIDEKIGSIIKLIHL